MTLKMSVLWSELTLLRPHICTLLMVVVLVATMAETLRIVPKRAVPVAVLLDVG